MGEEIREVPLDQINKSEQNVRDSDQEKGIDELAGSIKVLGLLQPVVLIGQYGKPPYELLIGQRRYLAHQALKWETIRAIFIPPGDPFKAAARSLAENLNRVEINHADAAKAVTALWKHYTRDLTRVMRATGLSKRVINRYLDIELRATTHMKELMRQKTVGPEDVKRALQAAGEDINKAERLLDLMVEQKFTTHQKARVVEYGREHKTAPAEEIIEKAAQPRVETSVTVPLPRAVRRALEAAVQILNLSPEEIAGQALEEWLSDKGFTPG